MRRFEGKTVFVTGAASGLAYAIVTRFLKEGARGILAFDVDGAALSSAASTWEGASDRVIQFPGDVRSRESVQTAVDLMTSRWGRIDILANVAGVAQEVFFLDIEPSDWQRLVDINLTGVFNVAQLVARRMAAQMPSGGAIINMSSKNGIAAEVKYAHYNATKAGVILLTKTMALDLAHLGIRCNAVAPGYCLTPLAQAIDPPDFMEFYKDRLIPAGRLGSPEDVAGAFAFLASDDALFITGHTLVLDGGQTCGDGRKLNAWPITSAATTTVEK